MKKQKILKLMVVLIGIVLLTICNFPIITEASDTIEYGDISANGDGSVTASLTDGVLTISGSGRMKDYNSDNDERAPWNNESESPDIKTVIFEEEVTNIGNEAFMGCFSLVNVVMSDSIIEIGDRAFYANMFNLENITVSNNLKNIGDEAFSGCMAITEFNLPSTLEKIGQEAFTGCSIEEVTIPANVNEIGDGAFGFNEYLKKFEVDSQNKYFSTSDEGILYNADKTTLVQYPAGSSNKEINIPTTVTEIKAYAFELCAIKEITIPSNVIKIGDGAFGGAYCSKIYFSGDINTIGDGIFVENSATIYAYKDTNILNYAKENNKKYVELNKDGGIHILTNPTRLKYEYGESIDATGGLLLVYDDKGNFSKVEMSNGMVSGFDSKTSGNQTLTITYEGYTTTFDVYVNEYVKFYINAEDGIMPNSKVKGDVNLDGYVTGRDTVLMNWMLVGYQVSEQAIQNADMNMDGVLNISDLTWLSRFLAEWQSYVIDGVNELKVGNELQLSLYREEDLAGIGEVKWTSSDESIARVDSNGKVTTLSKGKVIIKVENDIESDEFILYVVNEYGDISINGDGSVISTLNGTTLSITGKGEMKDFDNYSRWTAYEIDKVEIQDGITNIGNKAFAQFASLTNITIPSSVTDIGDQAFFLSSKLNTIEIPKEVTSIGTYAFIGTENLIVARDSYAEQYAKDNKLNYLYNIKYCELSKNIKVEYTGSKIIPDVIVKDGVTTLKSGTDYEIECSNNLNLGTATIIIKGIGNYRGNISSTFEIVQRAIEDAIIKGIEDEIYTGKPITHRITTELNGKTLIENIDYTITYKDNTNVGDATIEITGIGNYTGTISRGFKIKDFVKWIELVKKPTKTLYKYGEELDLTGGIIEVTKASGQTIQILMTDLSIKVTGYNAKKIGNQKLTITYEENTAEYSVSVEDYITGIEVVTTPRTKYKYGEKLNIVFGEIRIKMASGEASKLSMEDENITITGFNSKVPGNQVLTINYKGFTTTFKILVLDRIDLSECKLHGIVDKTYNGTTWKQGMYFLNQYNELLEEGIHYTVKYSNNKNPGKATVTITGVGAYKGTVKKTFIIKPKKVSGFKVKEQKTDSIKLSWSKHTGVTGYKVYSYNYKKSKWEYVGKTSSTSYTIKKLKAGTTYKYRVRAYKNVDGTQHFGAYTSSLKTTTKTKAPSISKLTTKSKKATIKWKKVSGASGYQIYMATSKNGKYSKIKTITKGSTTSYTKTKLKKNKKYYFKIRTYRTVDGKKVYSSYSSVKNIKVK